MTTHSLLDPKNDLVFKLLFATAPELLSALINAIRSEELPIAVIEVLNPRIDAEELAGKYIVLDILAQDAHGRRYNVEMQVRRYDAWSARSAYYLARTLTQQLNSGESYRKLKPVIGIHLLDFELFVASEQANRACWCFELRDSERPEVKLGDELQLNIIELPKADRLGLAQKSLRAWVSFFEHWQEESTMNQIVYPPVQQALERIRELSADAETRRLAFVRERALHDEISELLAAEERGKVVGKLEGKLEGEALLLERLLVKRFGALSQETRQRLSTARSEELETWAERILDASTLGAVFDRH